MNVHLRPTVRCSFDEEHGVLRVTLKEKVADQEGAVPEDRGETVVIYALRVRRSTSSSASLHLTYIC